MHMILEKVISLSWKDSAIKGDLKCLYVGLASWLNISILKLLIVGSFPPCFALYQPYLCSNVSFAIRMFQLENAVGSLVVWLSFFFLLLFWNPYFIDGRNPATVDMVYICTVYHIHIKTLRYLAICIYMIIIDIYI